MLKGLRKKLTTGFLDHQRQPTKKLFLFTGIFFLFILLLMVISPQLLETVPTDYSQLIINGDFEEGYNLPNWRRSTWFYSSGTKGYPSGSTLYKHSGTWACSLTVGEGYIHHQGWIEQDVNVGVNSITIFSYWAKLVAASWLPDYSKYYDATRIVVTVTYTDDTESTHIKEYETTAWQQVNVTDLVAGKTIKTIRFECDRDGVGYSTYIDDVILSASPPSATSGFEFAGILSLIILVKIIKKEK